MFRMFSLTIGITSGKKMVVAEWPVRGGAKKEMGGCIEISGSPKEGRK